MESWIKEYIDTPAGKIPVTVSELGPGDKLGAVRVRLSIRRMTYTVKPGLYALGKPGPESRVFVSANYKLSFDVLRKELKGLACWLLVLDTKGINVWCAAGKGTFGTAELAARVKETGLEKIVSHRALIVPQLGATGIAAHKVKELTGFSVKYGPVKAGDIPAFLASDMKTTRPMRKVEFPLIERLKLIPVEFVGEFKRLAIIVAVLFLLSGIDKSGYSGVFALRRSAMPILYLFLIYSAGTIMGPLLLPWLPGRSFAIKGAILGIIVFLAIIPRAGLEILLSGSWLLLFSAITSFLLMNFTGSSTYTSLSGVMKEMRIAVPIQAAAVIAAISLAVINRAL